MMIAMLRATLVAVSLCVMLPAIAQAAPPKTLFHYAHDAWALGTVRLSSPLTFREGKLLLFPGAITDLLHAKNGKPANVMLVYEVLVEDAEPYHTRGDTFFAPIEALPHQAYWRDNLPKTRRHKVLGGRRNVFRGDDIVEVRRHLSAFTTAQDKASRAGRENAIVAVVGALSSSVAVLRQDAVRYLSQYAGVARSFPPRAAEPYLAFLEDDDQPIDERVKLVEAAAHWKLVALASGIARLAGREDPVGAAALRALEALGTQPATDKLISLSRSEATTVRGYAANALGRRVAEGEVVHAAIASLLVASQPVEVRSAAAAGLGASASAEAVGLLGQALAGDDAAAWAAATALAEIGGDEAIDLLKKAVIDGPEAAAVGSVRALASVPACADCSAFLVSQHETHAKEAVRDLIGIVLEVDPKHEH